MHIQDDRFKDIGLYEHNIEGFKDVDNAYKSGEDIVALLRATGTGKTYIFLQLAYEAKNKKTIYVAPSEAILEHIKKVVRNNPNLNMKRDFPNLSLWTYQRFVSLSRKEIENIECDFLVLDEFHHLGAPVWGSRIKYLIQTHPHMRILGMSAYSVRDRGTPYERDMIDPDGRELFSGKVRSIYDICDAIIDGVLPKVVYRSIYPIEKIEQDIQEIEDGIAKKHFEKSEYQKRIEDLDTLNIIKKRIVEAPSLPEVLKKNIKPNGKYIYFCPSHTEKGVNDIKTIKEEAFNWLKEFINPENIVFYTTTSKMGTKGKKEREAFYNDVTLQGTSAKDKLQIMFAINQYNEGVHAPNIDGVIMGRATSSDIVFFEQLGRALSVRGDTKKRREELEKCDAQELLEMCTQRDILFNTVTSKGEIIDKLVAPVVIDLTGNISFIKELDNIFQTRIARLRKLPKWTNEKLEISTTPFDIEVENENIYEILTDLKSRLNIPWDEYYEIAKIYYEHYHDLIVPKSYKTNDGFNRDPEGVYNLGIWISNQRHKFYSLPKVKQEKLLALDFVLSVRESEWEEYYKLATAFYKANGHLIIPKNFKTNDGVTYNANGAYNLKSWVNSQKTHFSKYSKERQEKLLRIGLILNVHEANWNIKYEAAKEYYEKYGCLPGRGASVVEGDYVDAHGKKYKLSHWVNYQKNHFFELSKEKQEKLLKIGLVLSGKEANWDIKYKTAKVYYEKYGYLPGNGSSVIEGDYVDTYGKKYKLGAWINNQKTHFSELPKEKQNKLLAIGLVLNINETNWDIKYKAAKEYYEKYGCLPKRSDSVVAGQYIDISGKEYNISIWVSKQRENFPKLSPEKQEKLLAIGFKRHEKISYKEQWEIMYNLATAFYEHYGHLIIPQSYKTSDGVTKDPNGEHNLGVWISNQRVKVDPNSERGKRLMQIGMVFSVRKNKLEIKKLCQDSNINYDKNKHVLEKISNQELYSKLEFLKNNNLPYMDENGYLTEIFSMSNINMQSKYNVSLEELVSTFYLEDFIKKGM